MGVFTVSKGEVNARVREVNANDPAGSTIDIILFKVIEADAVLEDYLLISTLIAAAGNTEADFTNYARKQLGSGVVPAPTTDTTNNYRWSDLPDQTWVNAGGTLDNNLVNLMTAFNSGGAQPDSGLVPLTFHTVTATTTGVDLIAQFNVDGIFRAS